MVNNNERKDIPLIPFNDSYDFVSKTHVDMLFGNIQEVNTDGQFTSYNRRKFITRLRLVVRGKGNKTKDPCYWN